MKFLTLAVTLLGISSTAYGGAILPTPKLANKYYRLVPVGKLDLFDAGMWGGFSVHLLEFYEEDDCSGINLTTNGNGNGKAIGTNYADPSWANQDAFADFKAFDGDETTNAGMRYTNFNTWGTPKASTCGAPKYCRDKWADPFIPSSNAGELYLGWVFDTAQTVTCMRILQAGTKQASAVAVQGSEDGITWYNINNIAEHNLDRDSAAWENIFLYPSASPTGSPAPTISAVPSSSPSLSSSPTTSTPSSSPTSSPSSTPSLSQTPTVQPTTSAYPSSSPSFTPSASPTDAPTVSPSYSPSFTPSASPTDAPSTLPSSSPSSLPSLNPSSSPSFTPSASPTDAPSTLPSSSPSSLPSLNPSSSPSFTPSASPSYAPSASPSSSPSSLPSLNPSSSPSDAPSVSPSSSPSSSPTLSPTSSPTVSPTSTPTVSPTSSPTASPTVTASSSPTPAENTSGTAVEISICTSCDNVGDVLDAAAPVFAGTLGDGVTGEVAETSTCTPGCAGRMLLGSSDRSLQITDGDGVIGTTTFVLSFSGSDIENLSDAQVSELIKEGEEIIEAFLIGEGIDADIDFEGLTVVEPPAEAPSYSTKKGGKKGKKDKKGGKSAKKKKSSSSSSYQSSESSSSDQSSESKSSKKKGKTYKSEKKGKSSKS